MNTFDLRISFRIILYVITYTVSRRICVSFLDYLAITPYTVPGGGGLVFIVENIQTALAFTDLKNSVVIMGLGYGVDVLGKIPWLRHARCVYWGDIDTHGFAILNRARSYLPNAESALMDEKTLLSHRKFWVEEKKQHTSTELPFLNSSEQLLFQSLKNNTWGQHIRLEQERICWDVAWDVLQRDFKIQCN